MQENQEEGRKPQSIECMEMLSAHVVVLLDCHNYYVKTNPAGTIHISKDKKYFSII